MDFMTADEVEPEGYYFTHDEARAIGRELQKIIRHLDWRIGGVDGAREVDDMWVEESYEVVCEQYHHQGGGGAYDRVEVPPKILAWAYDRNLTVVAEPACTDDGYRPRNRIAVRPRKRSNEWERHT